MDVVIAFLLVTIISALKVGILRAAVFGVIFVASLLVLPMLLITVMGFIALPYTRSKRRRLGQDADHELMWRLKGVRHGKVLAQLANYCVYVSILVVTWWLGAGYFWAALVGLGFKLIVDLMWGDLPFQRPRAH